MRQLSEGDVYIRISHVEFRVPRKLFDTPGNERNYFTASYASIFMEPVSAFPGLQAAQHDQLSRPPAISPPQINDRSAQLFADVLELLRGRDVENVLAGKGESYRDDLRTECQYYRFMHLDQRLVKCHMSWNALDNWNEIVIPYSHVKVQRTSMSCDGPAPGYICYQRPYLDVEPAVLVLELQHITLSLEPAATGRSGKSKLRCRAPLTRFLQKLLEGIAGNTMTWDPDVEIHQTDKHFDCHVDKDTDICLNGKLSSYEDGEEQDVERSEDIMTENGKRRKTMRISDTKSIWHVERGLFRMRMVLDNLIFDAVRLDAYTSRHGRNARQAYIDDGPPRR